MRKPRIVVPGLPHHVILRGNNRRQLFSSANERGFFVFFMAQAMALNPIELHAMTLMSNHVHLLVTPRNDLALASFVKRFSQRYAQSRNRSRKQTGRLFEERYFSKTVHSEAQLAATTAYIELNPVRAGLLREPKAHSWSTFALHAGGGRSCLARRLWTPSPWYLALGTSDDERARIYLEFAHDVHERAVRPEGLDEAEMREAAEAKWSGLRVQRPNRSTAR